MVTEEEIESVSRLMKIRIMDRHEYVKKVHDMIDFFEMLDSAGVDEEDLLIRDTPISRLRDDKYAAFGKRLIDDLKQYRDGYVRAPRMS